MQHEMPAQPASRFRRSGVLLAHSAATRGPGEQGCTRTPGGACSAFCATAGATGTLQHDGGGASDERRSRRAATAPNGRGRRQRIASGGRRRRRRRERRRRRRRRRRRGGRCRGRGRRRRVRAWRGEDPRQDDHGQPVLRLGATDRAHRRGQTQDHGEQRVAKANARRRPRSSFATPKTHPHRTPHRTPARPRAHAHPHARPHARCRPRLASSRLVSG